MIGVTNKQIAMRLGQMVLVLLGISFITFCLVMLAPGDPVRQMIAGNEDIVVSQVEIDALRHELGLDQPFFMQYLSWLGRVLQGNFGFSFMMKKPVLDAVMEALPATVILAFASSVFMLLFAVPLGIYTAVKQNTWVDYIIRGFTFAGVSVPNFWMGLMLLWIFALKLNLFPIVGGDVSVENLILPMVTLGVVMASKYTRQVRATVLEELRQDYVMGARARGFSESHILWKEVLPNALLASDNAFRACFRLSSGRRGRGRNRVFLAGTWLTRWYRPLHTETFQTVQAVVLWIAFHVHGHQFGGGSVRTTAWTPD